MRTINISTKELTKATKSKRHLEAFCFAVLILSKYESGQLNDWNIRAIKRLCKCGSEKAKTLASDIVSFGYAHFRNRIKSQKSITDIVVHRLKNKDAAIIKMAVFNVNGNVTVKGLKDDTEKQYSNILRHGEKQTFKNLVKELSNMCLKIIMRSFSTSDTEKPRHDSKEQKRIKWEIDRFAKNEIVTTRVQIGKKYNITSKSRNIYDIFNYVDEMPDDDYAGHLYRTCPYVNPKGLSLQIIAQRMNCIYSVQTIRRMIKDLAKDKEIKVKGNYVPFGDIQCFNSHANILQVHDGMIEKLSVKEEFGKRIKPRKHYYHQNLLFRQMPNFYTVIDNNAFGYKSGRRKMYKKTIKQSTDIESLPF